MLVSFLVSHPHRFGLLLPLLKRFFPLPYIVLRFSGLNFFSLQNSNSKYLITVIPNQFGWPVNKAAVFVLYIYIYFNISTLPGYFQAYIARKGLVLEFRQFVH